MGSLIIVFVQSAAFPDAKRAMSTKQDKQLQPEKLACHVKYISPDVYLVRPSVVAVSLQNLR